MSSKPGVLLIGNFQSAHIHTHAVCEELAPRLRENGWHVVTASDRAGRLSRLTDMLLTTWRRRNEYEVAAVDVHAGSAFRWAESVGALLRTLRKPTVLTLRTGSLPELGQRYPERMRRLLGGATAVISPSPFLQQAMRAFRSDILHVPHGMNLSAYPFRLRSQPEPRLIWLRAFYDAYYNPILAVRVAALVAKEFPDVTLTMIGPDRGDGSLQAAQTAAEELGIAQRVQFQGGVAKRDIPHWLNRSDILLNTARVDNTPVTVIEAMACGLCVASTNVGGMPFLLRDGADALLSPNDAAEPMARNITRLLLDKGIAEKISETARRQAILHDWSKVVPIWSDLLATAARNEVSRGGHCSQRRLN